MSSFAMIQSAAKRLQGHARITPMLSSPFMDEIADRRVLVKAECLQHTGSFKFRGGWAAITALAPEERARGVIAYSSGNHAQGVAAAAKAHGVAAVILMPVDAPRLKIENTRALGAEVVLYDRAGGEDRDAIGLDLAQTRGLTLIKPYDEPEVIAGQGTTGLEIAEQAASLGVETGDVLICCGGGGLTCGVALALEGLGSSLQVRPAEPEGFDDVTRSLASGQVETNAAVSGSICDAILTPAPGEQTFPVLQRLCGGGIVVSEEEALRAMALAFVRLKIVLEPGGAVSLAAALFHPDQIQGEAVIAIATGGNVDTAVFQRALSSYA